MAAAAAAAVAGKDGSHSPSSSINLRQRQRGSIISVQSRPMSAPLLAPKEEGQKIADWDYTINWPDTVRSCAWRVAGNCWTLSVAVGKREGRVFCCSRCLRLPGPTLHRTGLASTADESLPSAQLGSKAKATQGGEELEGGVLCDGRAGDRARVRGKDAEQMSRAISTMEEEAGLHDSRTNKEGKIK